MNCDDAIELLPWLLNGTLEPGEEREVRAHLATCERCPAAFAETRLAWSVFGEHVPSEDLVAHAFGDRPGTDPELIERHVASCPSCASELEMVRSSRLLGENDGVATLPLRSAAPAAAPRRYRGWRASALAAGLVGVIAATGWIDSVGRLRSLEEQLAAERAQARPPVAAPVPAPDRRIAALEEDRRRLAAEIAAAGERERELTDRLARERQDGGPARLAGAINTVVHDLVPVAAGVVRSGEEGSKAVALSPSTEAVTLILNSRRDEAGGPGGRRVEVVDSAGRVVFRKDGLVLDPAAHAYTLTLERSLLAPGSYTVRVLGTTGEPETFPLVIQSGK